MSQTRLESFIEGVLNTVVGYCIAIISQIIIFPWFDINVPLSTNLWMGAWFTAISLVRSYVIRRWFNLRLRAAALSLAKQVE